MRIIKRSDNKVVDQLNQAPSKISMLSLLICSDAYIDALVKFLRASHVPQEIPYQVLAPLFEDPKTNFKIPQK